MNTLIYPLTFAPIFKDYPWGGRKLGEKLGRAIPDGVVAESWEIAAHPHGSSTVKQGPLAGLTLSQVQEKLGVALVGAYNDKALAAGKFPLLIKLLDANRWLSVQVHPNNDYAQKHGEDWGKTEMWVILHADPQAQVVFGFKPGVNREQFARTIDRGQCEEWLHRLPVQSGDVLLIPAGAIHAAGPGLLIAEIQQNSDVTYRIYDWGRPRPLHIQQALDVLNFDLVEPTVVQPLVLVDDEGFRVEQIAQCDYFEVERIHMPAGSSFVGLCDGDTFEIWAVLAGQATLAWDGEPLALAAVNWVLLPAELGDFQVTAEEESVLLRVFTP
jgi:mannose-6-phosphate isomerase